MAIDPLSIAPLVRAGQEGRLIVLCGAGISRAQPSNLPTVDVIVRSVLESVSEHAEEVSPALLTISHLPMTAPFEVFMGVVGQGLGHRVYELLDPLARGAPNTLHKALAALLVGRALRTIITTNFDDLLEQALSTTHLRMSVPVAYSWAEIPPLLAGVTVGPLLKVHGSLFDQAGKNVTASTVRTTISQIYSDSRVAPLQAAASAVGDGVVLVVGYSGRDRLDVMPFLSIVPCQTVYWLHHAEPKSLEPRGAPLATPELRTLAKSGKAIVEFQGNTENLLVTLCAALGHAPPCEDAAARPAAFRSLDISGGFVAPLFPKYAHLIAGYLLQWAGTNDAAAAHSFSAFLSAHGNSEQRLAAHALLSLGDYAARAAAPEYANQLLQAAKQTFWNLGDHSGLALSHFLIARSQLLKGAASEALQTAADALFFAERDSDRVGTGLLHLSQASAHESRGDLAEAHACYTRAAELGNQAAHPWLEAGAIQGQVRTAPVRSLPATDQLLRSLCLTHWASGGSAPAPWFTAMVNSFDTIRQIGAAIARGTDSEAEECFVTHPFLKECGLEPALRASIARTRAGGGEA